MANWVPPEEKGIFMSTLLFNGIGTIIDWSMSGAIIQNIGWSYAFYAVSIILAIFSVAWFYFIQDYPRNHPKILQSEIDYIESKLKKTTVKTKVMFSMEFSRMNPHKLIFFSNGHHFDHFSYR